MGLVLLLYFATFVSLISLGQLVSVFVNKAKIAGMLGFLTVVVLCAVGVSFSSILFFFQWAWVQISLRACLFLVFFLQF